MTPAIAPRAQVWWTAAAVLLERSGDFDHALAEQRGLHDHFAGELHARGAKVEALVGVDGEGADAAMKVSDRRVEEPAAEKAEHGVAEVFVQWWHRAGADATAKAIAHDHVGSV